MRRRGIALITVLTTAGLLVMLLAAFIQLNRDQFALTNSDLSSDAASDAARSAFQYCTCRLEHNKYWGSPPFTGAHDNSLSGVMELVEQAGTHTLKGHMVATDTDFTVDVDNNINGTATDAGGVPAGCCRLRINANRGTGTAYREALLDTAPIYDASAVASQLINIDATGKLNVASHDPLRNRLRSNGELDVPTYNGKFQFNPAGGDSEVGALWAKGDIHSGSRSLSNNTYHAEAVNATGGSFYPKSPDRYDVHDLQREEINLAGNVTDFPPGVYVFGTSTLNYVTNDGTNVLTSAKVPMLQRRQYALDANGNLYPGNVEEYWVFRGDMPANASNVTGLPVGGMAHIEDSSVFRLDTDSGNLPVTVALPWAGPNDTSTQKVAKLMVDPGAQLNVNGDFAVASDSSDTLPVVYLGYKHDANGNLLDIHDQPYSNSNQTLASPIPATITASKGNGQLGELALQGVVCGSGMLLGDGDVSLTPINSAIVSNYSTGISVFSKHDVNIKRLGTGGTGSYSFEGYQNGSAFCGLVYAKHNVNYDGDDANVTIVGSIVARDGSLNITHANDVNLIYDANYLKAIVKNLPGDRVKLEPRLWRE